MTELRETSGAFVSYPHRLLWHAVECQMAAAEEKPGNSWNFQLAAGLLAAAAFEAYLNHIGGEVLPEIWANERTHFSKTPYKGVLGKLRCLAEQIDFKLPNKSKRPFTSVIELKNLRDKIVHASSSRQEYSFLHKKSDLRTGGIPWMHSKGGPKQMIRMIADVEAFTQEFHNQLNRAGFHEAAAGSHPYRGSLGMGSFSVKNIG